MTQQTYRTYRMYWRLMKRQLRAGAADDARYSYLIAEAAALDLARRTKRGVDPVHRTLAREVLS